MNKFKFGDKISHKENGLGVVLSCYEGMDEQWRYSIAWQSKAGGILNRTFVESELTLASEWIKCGERMPPLTGDLLCEYFLAVTGTIRVQLGLCTHEIKRAYYMQVNEHSGLWVNERCKPISYNVTHWMPSQTPTPPTA